MDLLKQRVMATLAGISGMLLLCDKNPGETFFKLIHCFF